MEDGSIVASGAREEDPIIIDDDDDIDDIGDDINDGMDDRIDDVGDRFDANPSHAFQSAGPHGSAAFSARPSDQAVKWVEKEEPVTVTVQEDFHVDYCLKCIGHGVLMCCDGPACSKACHVECAEPKLSHAPKGAWYCPDCLERLRTSRRPFPYPPLSTTTPTGCAYTPGREGLAGDFGGGGGVASLEDEDWDAARGVNEANGVGASAAAAAAAAPPAHSSRSGGAGKAGGGGGNLTAVRGGSSKASGASNRASNGEDLMKWFALGEVVVESVWLDREKGEGGGGEMGMGMRMGGGGMGEGSLAWQHDEEMRKMKAVGGEGEVRGRRGGKAVGKAGARAGSKGKRGGRLAQGHGGRRMGGKGLVLEEGGVGARQDEGMGGDGLNVAHGGGVEALGCSVRDAGAQTHAAVAGACVGPSGAGAEAGRGRGREYLVKWLKRPHVHNEWVDGEWLHSRFPGHLAAYETLKAEGELPVYHSEWAEPERLLGRFKVEGLAHGKGGSKGRGKGRLRRVADEYQWLLKWRGVGYEHLTWEPCNMPFLSTPCGMVLQATHEREREGCERRATEQARLEVRMCVCSYLASPSMSLPLLTSSLCACSLLSSPPRSQHHSCSSQARARRAAPFALSQHHHPHASAPIHLLNHGRHVESVHLTWFQVAALDWLRALWQCDGAALDRALNAVWESVGESRRGLGCDVRAAGAWPAGGDAGAGAEAEGLEGDRGVDDEVGRRALLCMDPGMGSSRVLVALCRTLITQFKCVRPILIISPSPCHAARWHRGPAASGCHHSSDIRACKLLPAAGEVIHESTRTCPAASPPLPPNLFSPSSTLPALAVSASPSVPT
ncbi:unnamed protein product [Closterium sp. Naga37s-1]|nr:unnamed protein product [Closterium sp. Naga37s-1]